MYLYLKIIQKIRSHTMSGTLFRLSEQHTENICYLGPLMGCIMSVIFVMHWPSMNVGSSFSLSMRTEEV